MFIFVIFVLFLNEGVSALTVYITPERAHISENTNLTVMCRADKPLVGCQFKHGSRPLIDLSRGQRTNSTDDYKYFGNGLQQGECGVVLNAAHLVNDTFHFVGCRVRALRGGWVYENMEVYVTEFNSINILAMPPSEVVVLQGGNVSLLVKTDAPLTKCKFLIIPFGLLDFSRELTANGSSSYRYHGNGLREGHCGITLFNFTEELNAVGFVSISTTVLNQELFFVKFVVAKAPLPPVLELTSDILGPGSDLEAVCTVSGGRPWGNISWFIGNDLVRRDQENDAADDEWDPPRRQQTLTWGLREADIGRELRCVVTHVALSQALEARVRITVASAGTSMKQTTPSSTSSVSSSSDTSQSSRAPRGDAHHKTLPENTDDSMNLSVVIGLVVAILVSGVVAFWIYAWYISICCYSQRPATRDDTHAQIGMSKLLEDDEPMESVTGSSYVGLEA